MRRERLQGGPGCIGSISPSPSVLTLSGEGLPPGWGRCPWVAGTGGITVPVSLLLNQRVPHGLSAWPPRPASAAVARRRAGSARIRPPPAPPTPPRAPRAPLSLPQHHTRSRQRRPASGSLAVGLSQGDVQTGGGLRGDCTSSACPGWGGSCTGLPALLPRHWEVLGGAQLSASRRPRAAMATPPRPGCRSGHGFRGLGVPRLLLPAGSTGGASGGDEGAQPLTRVETAAQSCGPP